MMAEGQTAISSTKTSHQEKTHTTAGEQLPDKLYQVERGFIDETAGDPASAASPRELRGASTNPCSMASMAEFGNLQDGKRKS